MADALEARADDILDANTEDLERAEAEGITGALIDRLTLTPDRIAGMATGLREVIGLKDPAGEVIGGWTLPNGVRITKIRVPLGVVGIIYEARPNVTVDAAGLCDAGDVIGRDGLDHHGGQADGVALRGGLGDPLDELEELRRADDRVRDLGVPRSAAPGRPSRAVAAFGEALRAHVETATWCRRPRPSPRRACFWSTSGRTP